MNRKSKAGFTLVELMVVALIVAILAAVAIPLMSANKRRAMATEGEAGLGTIRTCLRAVYAESGRYDMDPNKVPIVVGNAVGGIPGLSAGDLKGRYWADADYKITSISSNAYLLTATPVSPTSEVAGITLTLDQGGAQSRSGL